MIASRKAGTIENLELGDLNGSVKEVDYRLYQADEITKRSNERFSWVMPNLIEAYIKHDLELCIWPLGPENGAFVINCPPRVDIAADLQSVCGENTNTTYEPGGLDKSIVLVQKVQLVNGVESVIPSFVRLEFFDDLNVCDGEAVYFFDAGFSPVEERVFVGADGEIDVVCFGRAISLSEGNGQVVKARPYGVNNCADRDRDAIWHWVRVLKFIDKAIRIEFDTDGVRLGFKKNLGLNPENCHLGFRPL